MGRRLMTPWPNVHTFGYWIRLPPWRDRNDLLEIHAHSARLPRGSGPPLMARRGFVFPQPGVGPLAPARAGSGAGRGLSLFVLRFGSRLGILRRREPPSAPVAADSPELRARDGRRKH